VSQASKADSVDCRGVVVSEAISGDSERPRTSFVLEFAARAGTGRDCSDIVDPAFGVTGGDAACIELKGLLLFDVLGRLGVPSRDGLGMFFSGSSGPRVVFGRVRGTAF